MNSQENKNVFNALPIKMEQGSPTFKILVGNSRRNKNSLKTKEFFGLEEFGLKAKSKLNTVYIRIVCSSECWQSKNLIMKLSFRKTEIFKNYKKQNSQHNGLPACEIEIDL